MTLFLTESSRFHFFGKCEWICIVNGSFTRTFEVSMNDRVKNCTYSFPLMKGCTQLCMSVSSQGSVYRLTRSSYCLLSGVWTLWNIARVFVLPSAFFCAPTFFIPDALPRGKSAIIQEDCCLLAILPTRKFACWAICGRAIELTFALEFPNGYRESCVGLHYYSEVSFLSECVYTWCFQWRNLYNALIWNHSAYAHTKTLFIELVW